MPSALHEVTSLVIQNEANDGRFYAMQGRNSLLVIEWCGALSAAHGPKSYRKKFIWLV